MKFSLVIPTYSITLALRDMAVKCASGYRPFVDELIITEDSHTRWPELAALADIYVTHDNWQLARNANHGMSLATGDFIGVCNSDTYLLEGNLRDLMVPGFVTFPAMTGDWEPNFNGALFCVPARGV